jgi:ABC-type Na+ efflux pump permease subunit
MYNGIIHAHSGLRWLVLIFLIISIIQSIGKRKNAEKLSSDKRFPLLTLIFTHLQLLLGFVLYFISPKVVFSSEAMGDPILRFYLVEHMFGMLVAIVLITIGYSKFKRIESANSAWSKILVFYTIGLILILISIPWPFGEYGGGWG